MNMYVSSSILIVALIGIVQGHPTISPGNDEYTISAGANYTFTCESDSPITWTYPKVRRGNDTLRPNVTINEEEENGHYTSKIHISNANDLAVGYYFCNATDDPNNYASSYLFVDENEKLYVGREEIIVASGKQYDALIIPCKPTSRSVTVKLYEGVGANPAYEMKVNTTTKDGFHWTYNNKEGLVLIDVHQPTAYHFTCKFKKNKLDHEVVVIAAVTKVHEFIREPIISRLDGALYNIEHENLTLKCEVEVESTQTATFSWMFKGTKLNSSEKYRISSEEKLISQSSNLTIYNFTKDADSGNYTCEVDDGDNKKDQTLFVDTLENQTTIPGSDTATLWDRYTTNIENIYNITIKFSIQILIKDVDNANKSTT